MRSAVAGGTQHPDPSARMRDDGASTVWKILEESGVVYSETFRSSALRPRSVQSPYRASSGLTSVHSPGR